MPTKRIFLNATVCLNKYGGEPNFDDVLMMSFSIQKALALRYYLVGTCALAFEEIYTTPDQNPDRHSFHGPIRFAGRIDA